MNETKLPKNPEDLAPILDYSFEDKKLLSQAFRHPSYVYEKDEPRVSDNQRMEFLGDAVINLAISHLLMESFHEMKEGELSKYRASLVSESGLYPIACDLQIGDYLLLGKGEERTQGRNKPSILTDALEALIGAVYLDGGFSVALRVIAKLFSPVLDKISLGNSSIDYKTDLQEYSQEAVQSTPEYRLEKETGPDHNKTFYIAVYLRGKLMGKGKGKSKKEAEREAAKEALACLRK
ncbi:MAG: ribonuclease III [Proteobacteria bacterium]|jgi:ribonuclease-3|nr:ribonuclease III [Pseudomonadota bacterium]